MTLPLLLLPGMMCDARLFAPQIAALSAQVPLLLAPPPAADTMAEMAAQILAWAPDRFALGGLSMGGILAMEILRQAPGRIDRLALLDTNPLAEKDEIKARRGPQIAAVQSGGLAEVLTTQMIPNYLAVDSPAPGTDAPALEALCLTMGTQIGAEVFVAQSRALRDRIDQTATLAAFGGPALVLCGTEDRLCPPERHQLMQGLMPRSRLVMIDGAGHLPTLETPDETTAALRRWLEDPR